MVRLVNHKRKLSNGDGGRPAKRVTLAAGAPGVVSSIQEFPSNKEDWAPIIATTPGLSIQPSVKFRAFQKIEKATTKRPSAKSSAPWLLESTNHSTINYRAEPDESNSAVSLAKHYVAVFDPIQGTLEVVEARHMLLRSSLRSETLTIEAEKARSTNLHLRQELGRTFGTKKAQKAISSLTENAISSAKATGDPVQSDAFTQAVLSSLTSTISTASSRASLDLAIDASKPRPPYDLSATQPADAYPISGMLGHEELAILAVRPWQDAVMASTAISTRSRFVARRVNEIATQSLAPTGDATHLKILRYIQLLLDFRSAHKPASRSSRRLPSRYNLKRGLDVPDSLLETVQRRFSTEGVMSRFQNDLLISWVLVLALRVDGWTCETSDLKEDLALETADLGARFTELGIKTGAVQKGDEIKMPWLKGLTKADIKSRRVARLTAPLVLPKVRSRVVVKKR